MCFFLYVSLFVELCVGCDGLVNVLFTLEGVAMPHIYLMFELCNACLYVSSPFERLLCDCECARLLWYVFHSFSYNLLLSEKKKSISLFWKTNLDYEITTLTTFPMSWHFSSWKTGIVAWKWDDTSKAVTFTLTADMARILVNATASNNVFLLCQVLYIYYTLLSLYHNPLQNVPYSDSTQSLYDFPFKSHF